MSPDLTQAEVNEICYPLTQGAAQARFLRSLGVTVKLRPNGKPLVSRQHYNTVRCGQQPAQSQSGGPVWRKAA